MTNLVTALSAPTAIVGATGAGKTFAAKGAVEELLDLGRRVVIIDPTGAWWGLRTGADCDPDGGFPVTIFGGDHADIPISPEHGSLIAAAIAGREVQAIIDTSEMTGGEKMQFLTAFLETLYAKNRAAIHLIVDEADEIAPQNPMPEERRLSGAFDKIVRRGRIKGFRPLMITQRPAVLHKNVLSQIGTLIALKLTSPQDRKAIDAWVKGNADEGQAEAVMSSLATLARGEGWFWAPAAGVLERRKFPPIKTFDSSRTPDNAEAVVDPPLSSVDVKALMAAMTPAAKPPAPSKAAKASADEIAAAEARGYERGLADWRVGFSREAQAGFAAIADQIEDAMRQLREAIASAPSKTSPPATPAIPVISAPKRTSLAPVPENSSTPGAGESKLLDAIAATPHPRSWDGAAIRAGYVPTGGGFRRARKTLIDGEKVVESGGKISPAASLKISAGNAPSKAELVDAWATRFGVAGRLFRRIAECDRIEVSALAEAEGYAATGGGFRRAMKALRSSGAVAQEGPAYRLSAAFLDAAGEAP